MPLNQTFISPITNMRDQFTSYYFPDLNDPSTCFIPSSSLPNYASTPWEYKMTLSYIQPYLSTTLTTQQPITDLTLTLQNNRKYIVEGHIATSTIRSANGIRIGVSASLSAETYYVIEAPTSTTAIGYSFNTTNLAASGPASDLGDFYLTYIKAIVITSATGLPTWTPTYSSEGAGGGATDVGIGACVIYYRQF